MKQLEDKLDKMAQDLSSIDVTLAKQHVVLEIHVNRTNLLEKQVSAVARRLAMGEGAIALVGFLSLIATILMLFKK